MKERQLAFETASEEDTIALGRSLGRLLKAGDVVGLKGELGSGKTWFTKGLALGLEVPPETVVTSPTFTLLNEYQGRWVLHHMDAYRLEDRREFWAAGLEEYFCGEGVVALEWADRWPEILPPECVRVELIITGVDSRRIVFSGSHPRALEILAELGTMAAARNRGEL